MTEAQGPAEPKLVFGLPHMQKESGERRDFLPALVGSLHSRGAEVVLERGYGSNMGLSEGDYLEVAPGVRFAAHREVYEQDYVMVVRCPNDDEIRLMRRGACLITMVHYPTRPGRVRLLRELGLEALSLDSIRDDTGRRLVENLRAVAWNGVETAMSTLRSTYPENRFDDPQRPPIRLTLLGAGAVGVHVAQVAVRYADEALRLRLAKKGVPGVQVTIVDYDLTGHETVMLDLLRRTDILVDATQRPDPGRGVIPNRWVGELPAHAVILDLSGDPDDRSFDPPRVKGIEGIPQGTLDQFVFKPDDPAFDALHPSIDRRHRRHVVSCYSWPGIYPEECMRVYGRQLKPLLRTLINKGGVAKISPSGHFFERAIVSARLSGWDGPQGVTARADGGTS